MSELTDVRALADALLADPQGDGRVYHLLVAEFDRAVLEIACRRCGGNQVRMAGQLGLSRTTLRGKLKRAGISCGGRRATQAAADTACDRSRGMG